jgi:dTDP-4-amino-4,6-dideoxygalactose transaminase
MRHSVIGGFFELELPRLEGGFLDFWGVPAEPDRAFALARSAFAALLAALDPPRVWIPAFLCRSVSDQARPDQLRFYPVGDRLTPDVGFLTDWAEAGDVVLGMNYFGRPPDGDFRAFASARPDLHFVEDCAHTIDTGIAPWGHFRIFSPRKLLGVPDGGIIIPARGGWPESIRATDVAGVDNGLPLIRRLEDDDGTHWRSWHDEYERWRLALQPSDRQMSKLSRAILALADPGAISASRFANFDVLYEQLQGVSFLESDTGTEHGARRFVPFGFPIRLAPRTRDLVRARLWDARVYAFRHFADLPAPEDEFPTEHALSRQLITLPCDQRYTTDDMEFIAATVLRAMG